MIITLAFSEPPTIDAWITIVEAIARAYPGAVLSEPVGKVALYKTTIEAPDRARGEVTA